MPFSPDHAARRRQCITATDSVALFGLGGKRTPLSIYLDKIGESEPDEPTEDMELGIYMEPWLLRKYQQLSGAAQCASQVWVETTCDGLPLGATLDAVQMGDDGPEELIELKSTASHEARSISEDDPDTLPQAWIVQAHHQMLVASHAFERQFERVRFVIRNWSLHKTQLIDCPWNHDLVQSVLATADDFWHKHVVPRRPPEVSSAADLDTVKRYFWQSEGTHLVLADDMLRVHASDLLDRKEDIKRLQKVIDRLEADLRLALGNADSAELPGGYSMSRVLRQRKGYEVKPSEYWQFSVKGPSDDAQ